MTAGDIVFGWIVPALGMAFFVAGAWTNAGIIFGKAPIPFAPGIVGAIALWNGPYDWMRSFAWVPLVLDAGCLLYVVLLVIALWAARAAPDNEVEAPAAPLSAETLSQSRFPALKFTMTTAGVDAVEVHFLLVVCVPFMGLYLECTRPLTLEATRSCMIQSRIARRTYRSPSMGMGCHTGGG